MRIGQNTSIGDRSTRNGNIWLLHFYNAIYKTRFEFRKKLSQIFREPPSTGYSSKKQKNEDYQIFNMDILKK